MPFPAHWKVSKKKLRVQPKNLWIFPDPTHRRGMRASRRDSTSPSDAPIGAFGGKNAEKRGKSSKFPTLPGEIELVWVFFGSKYLKCQLRLCYLALLKYSVWKAAGKGGLLPIKTTDFLQMFIGNDRKKKVKVELMICQWPKEKCRDVIVRCVDLQESDHWWVLLDHWCGRLGIHTGKNRWPFGEPHSHRNSSHLPKRP